MIYLLGIFQEDANRGKPNWEHLADDLHVLLTVEDTENRAKIKLARAVEEVKRLLVPVSIFLNMISWYFIIYKSSGLSSGVMVIICENLRILRLYVPTH